jgi:dolichyldiphosphatase
MQVFELTYIEHPATFLGFFFACASLLPLFLIFSLIPIFLFTRNLAPLVLLVGVLLSTALNETAKRIIREPRPATSHRGGYGMPSDHSQCCVFWTVSLFVILNSNKQIKKYFVWHFTAVNAVMAATVATSRVFLGVHSVRQVLAGAAIGAVLGGTYGLVSARIFASNYFGKLQRYTSVMIDNLVFGDKVT